MTTYRGRPIMALGALALTLAAITAQPVAAQQRVADPFVRADASFSPHRLNRVVKPQVIGKRGNCYDDECEWVDKAGVAHTFGGKLLAIKVLAVPPGDRRALPALGIGTARDRSAVLTRVRAFLPEIQVTCLEAGQAGEGEGIAACGGSFKKGGWIKLLFGSDNRLISARIDAFQIN